MRTMYDYYQILNVPSTATLPEIKLAYHSLLLKHHPDKRRDTNNQFFSNPSTQHHVLLDSDSKSVLPSVETFIDIALLKEAYRTLSSPQSRSSYDLSLSKKHQSYSTSTKAGPRPAQIVSLEDFTPLDSAVVGIEGDAKEQDVWVYPCRCGGNYTISESDMDRGQHLIGCQNCSEAIWVGYELAQDDELQP